MNSGLQTWILGVLFMLFDQDAYSIKPAHFFSLKKIVSKIVFSAQFKLQNFAYANVSKHIQSQTAHSINLFELVYEVVFILFS